jgi:hypothetical protein
MIGGAELGHLAGRANPIYLEGKLLPLTVEQARELKLKDQEVVQALVRSRSTEDLSLLIRGRTMNLPAGAASVGWLPGQTVTLQVQALAQGAIALLPTGQAQAASLPTFFSQVGKLLFRPPGQQQLLQAYKPGFLDTLLQLSGRQDLQAQWRGMQMSMAQLDPQALGQAMVRAMGSEVSLARGQLPPAEDPKQLLRRLAVALSQRGEEGADEVEEGGGGLLDALETLGRAAEDVEASQVQAVQAQAQREILFSMVLPFVDAEPVELQFRRAPHQGDGEPPPFIVNVHSNNQALGEIWLKTQLQGLDRVELTMWAMREGVVQQARERSAELGTQLAEAGLSMQSFQVIHGARPAAGAEWVPSGRGLVVDIRA